MFMTRLCACYTDRSLEVSEVCPFPILFVHSGATCNDAAIVVYTVACRLLWSYTGWAKMHQ